MRAMTRSLLSLVLLAGAAPTSDDPLTLADVLLLEAWEHGLAPPAWK